MNLGKVTKLVITQRMLNMLAEMCTALDSEAQVLTRFVNIDMAVDNLQERQISGIRIAILT